MALHVCLIGFNLLSFMIGVYLIDTILNRTLKKYIQTGESPTSILVFKAGFILGFGILFYSWQESIQNASIILKTTLSGNDLVISMLSYCALFWMIALLILAILSAVVSTILMLGTDRRNIPLEIAQGSMGYAIFFSSVLLALTIGMLPIIIESYELFLPYPDVPMFR